MDLGIHGRVAIVTGGSRGLGRSAALSLAREGVRVAICARNPEDLHRTVQELRDLGAEAMGVVADVTHPEGPEKVYRETLERYGQVDILVNNVGGRRGGQSLEDTTEQDFLDALMLNLFSAIRLTRLALPEMRRRRWGRIINIASIWGREYGGTIAYMTAKAALIAFTKGLARQVAKDNVLVNSVAPGSILFPGGAGIGSSGRTRRKWWRSSSRVTSPWAGSVGRNPWAILWRSSLRSGRPSLPAPASTLMADRATP
jgi:3-oxoacyl-[acyl-carrier protein] reductase